MAQRARLGQQLFHPLLDARDEVAAPCRAGTKGPYKQARPPGRVAQHKGRNSRWRAWLWNRERRQWKHLGLYETEAEARSALKAAQDAATAMEGAHAEDGEASDSD